MADPQSSLDQALQRIMQPLSTAGGPTTAATTPTTTPTTPATSVTLGGTPPPPAPTTFATDPAIAVAQKQIDDNNQAIMSLISQTATPTATTTPAASTAAPVAPLGPDLSGFVRPSTAPVSSEPAMISRQALADRQIKQQQDAYTAQVNQQIESLRASGLYQPYQLDIAAPKWSPNPSYGALGGTMVANPYYTAPVAPAGQELTGRAYLGQIGVTPQAFRGMARPERQALRGQYQSALAGLPAV